MYEPIGSANSLDVVFNTTEVLSNKETKPFEFISYLTTYSGKDSLISSLKNKGYITGLKCGGVGSYSDFAQFAISVDLTEEGLSHVSDVIGSLFSYMRQLSRTDIPSTLFEQFKAMNTTKFLFKEEEDLSTLLPHLSNQLFFYPDSRILENDLYIGKYSQNSVKHYLNQFYEANSIVMLGTKKSAERLFSGHFSFESKLEKWYTTRYVQTKGPSRWRNLSTFSVRNTNQFLTNSNKLLLTKVNSKVEPGELVKSSSLDFYSYVFL